MTPGWVAVIGEAVSRHEDWGATLDHVAARQGVNTAALWFSDRPDSAWIFDGPPNDQVQERIARVFDPVQYQRARSRGDLEDVPPFFVSRAGACTPRPDSKPQFNLEPNHMSKTAISNKLGKYFGVGEQAKAEKKPLSAPALYYIVQDHFQWRGKRHRTGERPELAPRNAADQHKLDLHLKKGWIRLATEEDRAEAVEIVRASIAQPAGAVESPMSGSAAPVQVRMVPIANIRPDPTQPRKTFSPDSMKELVDSIKQQGVEQAILVRPMGRWRQIVGFVARQFAASQSKAYGYTISAALMRVQGIDCVPMEEFDSPGWIKRLIREGRIEMRGELFVPLIGALEPLVGETTLPGEPEWLEIVYGERRWRGAQEAGLTEIPAKVQDLTDTEAAEKQAVENLDRQDLTPLEEAGQYQKLLALPGYGMERLVETTGKAKNTIYGKLKLLQLPDAAKAAVEAGVLPAVTAERIARLEPTLQKLATTEILHPKDHWSHAGKGVLSDRAAQEKIKELEKQAAEETKCREIEAQLVKDGYRLLNDLESRDANRHGGEVNGGGWMDGSQKCERDPKGRTWSKVLKGAENVTRYATTLRIWSGGEYTFKGVPVFKREEANAALKKLGLWDVEGSAKDKEKAAQKKEREKKKRAEAEMLADIAGIVESATSQDPRKIRAVARGVVHAFTAGGYADANVKFIAARRDIVASPQGIIVELRKLADKLPLPALLGLVAEIALVQIGRSWENMQPGRGAMREFLDGKDRTSAGARTIDNSGEAVAA